MRSDIFIEWLQYLDNWFRIMDQKILLLIDNAGSHFNPKILDESNNINEELSETDSDNEEIVAESSHSAQIGKGVKKDKQKKNLILNLPILSLFIFLLILQLIFNLWMRDYS